VSLLWEADLRERTPMCSPTSSAISEPDVTYTHRSGIFLLLDLIGFLGSLWDE
jgi:hypothetical protein